MNLNINSWKEFKIKDIFRLEPTKGVDSTELLEGDDINYIGAKHDNNGLMMRCQLEGFESWVSKGNCIVFIQLGAGSAGYVNYIPDDFIGMSGKTICGYVDGIMNPQIGLFLTTILCKERPKYSFGRSWTGDRLRETIIKLPTDLSGNPDWKFMEQYIKSLNHKPLTTKNGGGYESPTLGTTDWKEYKLTDIFPRIEQGKAHDNLLDDGDEMVYIGAKKDDNGVMRHCANNTKLSHDGNCIVFICNGQGSVGYSLYLDRPFIATTDVKIGYGPNINKYTGLFLVTVLDRERGKYSFGRKWGPHIKNTILRLPTKNSQPDWDFMENYIKRLPYGDRI